MGIGAIVGGALKGYGDGMAEMARSREDERRQAALINMRSAKQKEEYQVQYGLQDQKARNQSVRDNWINSEQVNRTTAGQIQVDGARTENDAKLEKLRTENAASLARLGSTLNIDEAQYESGLRIAEAEAAAGRNVSTWVIDKNSGQLVGIRTDGTRAFSGIQPQPKDTPKGKSDPIADARERERERANGSGAPTSTPQPAKRVAATGGVPRLRDGAAAEAFARNPANKGKSFIGPDGKTYRVPDQ